jgi:hypothetical protein
MDGLFYLKHHLLPSVNRIMQAPQHLVEQLLLVGFWFKNVDLYPYCVQEIEWPRSIRLSSRESVLSSPVGL